MIGERLINCQNFIRKSKDKFGQRYEFCKKKSLNLIRISYEKINDFEKIIYDNL